MMHIHHQDEAVQGLDYQVGSSGSPGKLENRHKSLPQNQDEEGYDLSTRSQLTLGQSNNLEETQHQLSCLTQRKDMNGQEKKGDKEKISSVKYVLFAGLAMMIIMILLMSFNQKDLMHQKTGQLGIEQTKSIQDEKSNPSDSQEDLRTINLEIKGNETNQTVIDKLVEPQEKPIVEKGLETDQKQPTVTNISTFQDESFAVPRFLWTFTENIQGNNFFVQKCLDTMKRYAANSSFVMTVLNSKNYKNFIQPETAEKIRNILEMLKERMAKQPKSNLRDYFQTINRRLISLFILNQNGGIFLEKNILLTESFQWLANIQKNIYVNKGSDKVKARYFGFFDFDHSSHLQKHNKSGAAFEAEKYMVKYPTVEPYFIAAQPNQAFLTETMAQYVDLLVNPASLPTKMTKYSLEMQVLKGKDLYSEIFYLSQLIVLHRRQELIDRSGRNRHGDTFAIDEYGLMTMNERYFPRKLAFLFSSYSSEKIYKNIAKYTLADMEATTGPMRYIACIPLEYEINDLLRSARQKQQKYFVNPESFLGKHLIANDSEPYVLRDFEKSNVNTQGKSWDKLPKIIWFYWDTGIKNSKVANKLCFDNIRRAAALNSFQIRELNDSNTAQYLGPELNDKINNYLKNKKIQTFPQTKSDFVRLGIMIKYGGIYMDVSYFSIKGLEWIVNITQAPSESIFNRYGEMPRSFMFFHPHYGTYFDWTYDKQANTKKLVVSAYQNNLLIAQPNQQLFKDWLEEFGRFITTPYEKTQQRMKDLGVFGIRWTNKDYLYLAAMDSIKNVMAQKNRAIEAEIKRNPNYKGPKSAPQFYGLWSVSGYREQQKFRPYTNFDFTYNKHLNDRNIFLWRYSETYVQGLIGNITHLVKLYHWNVIEFNSFLNQGFNSNFSDLHPQSFAAKYLYNPELHKLSKKDGQLSLELLQS